MKVPFLLLDVFAEAPFSGNQLCVVAEPPPGLTSEQMLTITREIDFSESTFVTSVREGGYHVRIFTPQEELPFAGHPTLGTAFALVALGLVGPDVVQTCEAGEVPVRIDLQAARGRMRQLPATFGLEVADRVAVASASGLTPQDLLDGLPVVPVSTGIAHLMVPVRDEAALRRAVRDERGCNAVCEAAEVESLYLFTVRKDGEVLARMFDRYASIGEDPATGSAAGPLGAYLSAHGLAGMPGRVVISQGEMVGRPSILEVDVAQEGDAWVAHVGGAVQMMGEGWLRIS